MEERGECSFPYCLGNPGAHCTTPSAPPQAPGTGPRGREVAYCSSEAWQTALSWTNLCRGPQEGEAVCAALYAVHEPADVLTRFGRSTGGPEPTPNVLPGSLGGSFETFRARRNAVANGSPSDGLH